MGDVARIITDGDRGGRHQSFLPTGSSAFFQPLPSGAACFSLAVSGSTTIVGSGALTLVEAESREMVGIALFSVSRMR